MRPGVVTEGVLHCPCLEPAKDPLARLAVDVGKLLPEGTWMDGHVFDFGRQFAIAAVRPDGRRGAVSFEPNSWPSAATIAGVLS